MHLFLRNKYMTLTYLLYQEIGSKYITHPVRIIFSYLLLFLSLFYLFETKQNLI